MEMVPPVRWMPVGMRNVCGLLGRRLRRLRHRENRYEDAAFGFGTKLDAPVDQGE
jgi:hypothetical protein